MNFDEWYEQEIGSGNKPEYEAAKWAWNHQQAKIDVITKRIMQEIELIKEYRTSLINEVVTGKINLN